MANCGCSIRACLETPNKARQGCKEWPKQGEDVPSHPLEPLNTGGQEPAKLCSISPRLVTFISGAEGHQAQ